MKRVFGFIIVGVMFWLVTGKAQDKGLGVGVIIGQPTGFSVKSWVNQINALEFGLGFSFSKNDSHVHIHADYLWHSFDAIKSTEKFVLYYGPGLKLKTGSKNDNAVLGIRGVIGLAWMASKVPIDVFLEVAPVLNFVPGTGFNIDAGFGARYYFE